jgi:hypothetical protein
LEKRSGASDCNGNLSWHLFIICLYPVVGYPGLEEVFERKMMED